MHRRQFLISSLAGMVAPTVALPERAGTNQLTVTEHLGWNWTHELLSMPVRFAPGVTKSESIAVRSDAGELTAGQLENVKRHAGGSIAEATCHFYANLPAFATRTWTVDAKTAAPRTDLRIDRSEAGIASARQCHPGREAARREAFARRSSAAAGYPRLRQNVARQRTSGRAATGQGAGGGN